MTDLADHRSGELEAEDSSEGSAGELVLGIVLFVGFVLITLGCFFFIQ